MTINIDVVCKFKGEILHLKNVTLEMDDSADGRTIQIMVDPKRADFWQRVKEIAISHNEGVLESLVKKSINLE